MRVVIDNNIILDALNPNPQFEYEAQKILRLAAEKKINGYINANSLTDIFYVLRKTHGIIKAKDILSKLFLIVDIIGIEPIDCVDALNKPMNDFEDALVEVCATKIKADYIVSRDETFIKSAENIEIIKPAQLLKINDRKEIADN